MVVRLFHILSFGSFKALFALGMGRVRWGVRQARRVCRARRLWVVSWVGEGGGGAMAAAIQKSRNGGRGVRAPRGARLWRRARGARPHRQAHLLQAVEAGQGVGMGTILTKSNTRHRSNDGLSLGLAKIHLYVYVLSLGNTQPHNGPNITQHI